jgi:molecular chaperone HtpG
MSEKLDLSSAEEKKAEEEKLKESEEKLKPVIEVMSAALKEQIKEVRISDRLTDSPACLVSVDRGASAHMERILRAMGQPLPKIQRIMEINPTHPLFDKMLQAPKELQQDWAEILYDQALLNEGSQIENPLQYSKKIAKLMMSVNL